jgi:hypothetical protein
MPVHQGEVVNYHFGGMLPLDQSFELRPDQTTVKLTHVRNAVDVQALSCLFSEKMGIIDSG